MLCDKCSKIHFRRHYDSEAILKSFYFKEDYPIPTVGSLFYVLHENKLALQKSADQGCHFCAMLWGGLFEDPQVERHLRSLTNGQVMLERSTVGSWIEDESGLDEWDKTDNIFVMCEERRLMIMNASEPSGITRAMMQALTNCENCISVKSLGDFPCHTVLVSYGELQVTTQDLESIANPYIYSPWLDTTTMSKANLILASIWLNNCLQNHQPCRKAQKESILPSRVVNINDPLQPRLVDGDGRKEQYVTLSYKWGSSYRYVTESGNIDKHKQGIRLGDLPATFRDAIYVAHTLGFDWLWIDALCIIQNSQEDKKTEISKMDRIFQASTLTIYAVVADHADAGLAVIRDPRTVKPCRLDLKATIDKRNFERSGFFKLYRPDKLPKPLFTRGWVLQEQILATRGLLFGPDEIIWRCHCGSSTEAAPSYKGRVNSLQDLGSLVDNKWKSYSAGIDGFDLLRFWVRKKNPLPDRTPWQRENQFDQWYTLIKEYSRRSLTNSSDVLPGIAGLASAMAKTHGCTYLDGLWKEDLQTSLCWYVIEDQGRKESDDLGFSSWSWASQWGKVVEFSKWENHSRHIVHQGVGSLDDRDAESMSFIDIKRKPLVLSGRLRTAKFGPHARRQVLGSAGYPRGRWIATVVDSGSGQLVGEIALDDRKHISVDLIYCLLCMVREKNSKLHITCLGLVPTNSSYEEFKRVGLVYISRDDWFGNLNRTSGPEDARLVRKMRIV